MGALNNYFVTVFLVLSVFNLAQCTEFLPVYSWGTSLSVEKVPALQKISQDSFRDYLLEQLKSDPFIVVFAEQTLSPEDFAQKDGKGQNVFSKLAELRSTSKVTYMPYVQNPIRGFKHLGKEVLEMSIETLKSSLNIPETKFLIVDLNDAKDDEHRMDMLKRHDSNIIAIYNKILEENDNVVAYYTAYHTSWVASENNESRQRRSLLADDETIKPIKENGVLYYANGKVNWTDPKTPNTPPAQADIHLEITVSGTNKTLTLSHPQNSSKKLELNFAKTLLDYVELTSAFLDGNEVKSVSNIYAPTGFSYHCSNQVFKTKDLIVTIPGFQVEVFYSGNDTKFGDFYDCVGFTSAPIWSGLFVTFILLFIMTIGLTMMMDIKTMDRFDDAKGKTITINASE